MSHELSRSGWIISIACQLAIVISVSTAPFESHLASSMSTKTYPGADENYSEIIRNRNVKMGIPGFEVEVG